MASSSRRNVVDLSQSDDEKDDSNPISLHKAMTDYCNSCKDAPCLEEMRGLVDKAKSNVFGNVIDSLSAAMKIIAMVLYLGKQVDLLPLQVFLKKALEMNRGQANLSSSSAGANYSPNQYEPATIAPFATHQSALVHPQDHSHVPISPSFHHDNSSHPQPSKRQRKCRSPDWTQEEKMQLTTCYHSSGHSMGGMRIASAIQEHDKSEGNKLARFSCQQISVCIKAPSKVLTLRSRSHLFLSIPSNPEQAKSNVKRQDPPPGSLVLKLPSQLK
jgi:hypothetical protein